MNTDGGTGIRQFNKFPRISFPWHIVMLGLLLLFVANSYTNTFGIFFKPIAQFLDVSRAVMSSAYTVRSLAVVAFIVPIGYWADRYGANRVLLPCFILLGIGMLAISSITHMWQLYLVQGLCIGIGGSGAFICVMSTVAKWHKTKRGLALGITSVGSGLSSIVFPPLATKLIEARDWQFAIFILGLIILLIGVPASLVMKNPPDVIKAHSTERINNIRGPFDVWPSLLKFLRNPSIFSIILMFVLIGAVGNLLTNHLVNYATDIGITPLVAAGMMSVTGVASVIGRLLIGSISDRIGSKNDVAVCCILMAVSFILLISKVLALMWVAAVLFGIGFGGTSPLVTAIMGERVSIEQLSTATGLGTMGFQVGAATGTWLGGLIFDISGSYLWALILSATVSIAAVTIALRTPSARREIL